MERLALDIETTGISPEKGNRVIELAIVERDEADYAIEVLYHQFFNPGKPLGQEVTAMLGVDDAYLAGKPDFGSAAPRIRGLLEGNEVICHHAPFCARFLEAEFARAGEPVFLLEHETVVTDTLTLARIRLPDERHTLDRLCRYFNLEDQQTGRAGSLRDAWLTMELFGCLEHLRTDDEEPVEYQEYVDITESLMPGVRVCSWLGFNNPRDLRYALRSKRAVAVELETLDFLDQRGCDGVVQVEDVGEEQLRWYRERQRQEMHPSFRLKTN